MFYAQRYTSSSMFYEKHYFDLNIILKHYAIKHF